MQNKKFFCEFLQSKANSEICQHKKKVLSGEQQNNCYFCGIYISDDSQNKTYRSATNKYNCFLDISQFSICLTKKTYQRIRFSKENIYLDYRCKLIEMIFTTSEKLQFSLKTSYLAIHYLDVIMSKHIILPDSYENYAIACLMVAAKTIELDEKIPFFSKLAKLCSFQINISDVKSLEKKILELLDWELQASTAVELLEFYLSQGVLFSKDEIELAGKETISFAKILTEKDNNSQKNSKNVSDLDKGFKNLALHEKNSSCKLEKLGESNINLLVSQIESQAYNILAALIKDSNFIGKDIKILVPALIAYLRKIVYIKNVWNKDLFIISNGIMEIDFNEVFLSICEKFQPISHSNKEKNNIILPKISNPTQKNTKESYFSRISQEINKATKFLLK